MLNIEIKNIDLRYESLRLKDAYAEKMLLSSILEKGILQPLSGIIKSDEKVILLDGFKRLRCSRKLNITNVFVESLGENEELAIIQLIRLSNARFLNTLEQAVLLNELFSKNNYTLSEIANQLERSKAWVSIRLGIIDEMSDVIKDAIFSGDFPLRSYMYTLRPFTRVNGVNKKELDAFVNATKGKKLSTREIETLAYSYFRGGNESKEQIEKGNHKWLLKHIKNDSMSSICDKMNNKLEIKVIHDLELVQKYMNHIIRDLPDSSLQSTNFKTNAYLIIEGLLNKLNNFNNILGTFYDKSTHKRNY